MAGGAVDVGALDYVCRAHPEFHVVDHEVLCRDPHAEYRKLFAAIGSTWSDEVESHIERANRPGEGYETYRIVVSSPGSGASAWRLMMRAAADVIARFPIAKQYDLDV